MTLDVSSALWMGEPARPWGACASPLARVEEAHSVRSALGGWVTLQETGCQLIN